MDEDHERRSSKSELKNTIKGYSNKIALNTNQHSVRMHFLINPLKI